MIHREDNNYLKEPPKGIKAVVSNKIFSLIGIKATHCVAN
ncbi:hypothetical protein SAMN05444266_101352 [Chitinophaga jiangningensis]|uniref:Uncharacterized protein n=1 Tax=Chitinophaga jiangningensis TaxID=1419482 RepID=A0A1M6VT20_9BACT|nr:hypothetical protein SAMN05444266_101352 [Chitinophaga jiangningensis]